jgi:hypothetical protein
MEGTSRPRRALAPAAAALVLVMLAAPVQAADSPLGDRAGAWPTAWHPYLLADGSVISDPVRDVGCGSGYCDVSGGGTGTLSSVYWASDGANVFFRLRVRGDPRNPAAGGFRSTAYVLQIAVNRTLVAAVGLDAKPANRDFVYVANADGTAHSEIYAFPFDGSGGESSAGARALPDGSGHYFVDWQVPIARIRAQTGGAVTATSPIQLFFGTSQSANLSVINKDFMVGNSVDFGTTSTIVFVPPVVLQVPPGAPSQSTTPQSAPGPGGPVIPLLPNTAVPPTVPAPARAPLMVAFVAALVTAAATRRSLATLEASANDPG